MFKKRSCERRLRDRRKRQIIIKIEKRFSERRSWIDRRNNSQKQIKK